jgi:hypothetical protein
VSDEQTVDNLKLPPNNQSVDYASMTDDDLKHLVIYYATIIRDPRRRDEATFQSILDAWHAWPKELYERFKRMVIEECEDPKRKSGDSFWARPADNNIRYGI